jgi:hypothetical protein
MPRSQGQACVVRAAMTKVHLPQKKLLGRRLVFAPHHRRQQHAQPQAEDRPVAVQLLWRQYQVDRQRIAAQHRLHVEGRLLQRAPRRRTAQRLHLGLGRRAYARAALVALVRQVAGDLLSDQRRAELVRIEDHSQVVIHIVVVQEVEGGPQVTLRRVVLLRRVADQSGQRPAGRQVPEGVLAEGQLAAGDQVRQHLGIAVDLGVGQGEQIEGIEGVAARGDGAEGVEDDHLLAHVASAAGGDLGVFALGVDADDGTLVAQEVGDDGGAALAGTGGGDGQQMPLAGVGHQPGRGRFRGGVGGEADGWPRAGRRPRPAQQQTGGRQVHGGRRDTHGFALCG